MSNTNHDFIVKNGLVVGSAITSTGTLTQAGQTFPASDGSANQYLKTNGSGALSWGTVSTSFNITDGTTTDTVGLTETVTFTGGTNISLAVTDNTVTITNDVVDSDDITEGSSNLFYTDARAIAAIQGASNLTIDGGTLYVDTAADRVGISDTSPQQKLDVAGNIGVNGSEVIDASGNIVGSVADSAMTVGGSLAGVLSNLKVQYGTSYSGTPIQGSFFFDSLNQKLKVYTGSAFIDAVPAGSGGGGGGGATDANTTFRNYSYTLTGTTSAVSGVDDNELTAGAFIVGHKYTITSVGNTDFTAIGASANIVGVVFTATGVGSGTGQAKSTLFYDTTSSTTRVVAYVNGIKQVYGSGRDFAATTGTSVAFTYNLGSGDTVDIQVYELLTNDAYYLKSEVYTQTEVNSQISTALSGAISPSSATINDINISRITGANDYTQIKKTSTGSNLAITSQESIYLNIDANNDQTNRSVIIATNTDVPGSGTVIAKFQEDGSVGIGTSSPAAKLDVNGLIQGIAGASSSGGLKLHTNSGINVSANAMSFHTGQANGFSFNGNSTGADNNNQLVVIRADGKVGIGTGTPGAALDVRGSMNLRLNNGLLFFTDNNTAGATNVNGGFIGMAHNAGYHVTSGDGGFGSNANSLLIGNYHTGGGDIILATTNAGPYPSGRVIIKEGGNVGIGTNSPSRLLHLSNSSADPYLLIDGSGANRDSGIIINAGGGERKVVRGDLGGNLYFGNSNQLALYNSNDVVINESGNNADFRVEVPQDTHMFLVDASANCVSVGNGNSSPANDAMLHIGGTSSKKSIRMDNNYGTGNAPAILLNNSGGGTFSPLYFEVSGQVKGSITADTSGTTYNTTSDRRLKDNIETITDGADKLMAMKPITHTWKANSEDPAVHGFIAQEMQQIVPEAVTGDAESDEMMSMDYGRITPVIVAALQDALKEIKELKTRIDELEAK